MKHELKCWPQYFERLFDGTKTFEVRRDDRGYQRGDALLIREFDPKGDHDTCTHPRCRTKRYTGREMEFEVGFILRSMPGSQIGIKPGLELGEFVVMSLIAVTTKEG